MNSLIQAAVSVKGPFALLAFVCVLLLLAFRTRAVPERLFGLLEKKLTRERFFQLLHRSLLCGSIVIVLLFGTAVLGEIFAQRIRPQAIDAESFRKEIQGLKADTHASAQAIEDYEKALALARDNKLGEAIGSLQASLEQVPTLSAQYTLAYLYKRQGHSDAAREEAGKAATLAAARGDSLGQVRANALARSIATTTLLGPKDQLPQGGKTFETATLLRPGRYLGPQGYDSSRPYFKVAVQSGQVLRLTARTADGQIANLWISFYDSEGARLETLNPYNPSEKVVWERKCALDGDLYLSFRGAVTGSVFLLIVGE